MDFGELVAEGGIDNDVQVLPWDPLRHLSLSLSMDDLLDFIEQLLGSADAESGDQDRAPVFEAGLNPFLQSLHTLFSARVGFVTVGTF